MWPTGVASTTGYLYQWFACDAAVTGSETEPEGCAEISGATGSTFSVTASQEGKHVTARVTFSSSTVTTRIWWTTSAGLVQIAVSNTQVPTVSNDGEANAVSVGRTLTANNGTWVGTSPLRYSYQWFSCSRALTSASSTIPTTCSAISAATASTFQITSAQTGRFLMAGVGAINDVSPDIVWRYTASTTEAQASPQATANPVLSSSSNTSNGRPKVESTITVTPGKWTGLPTPRSTYHWYQCESAVTAAVSAKPADCEPIAGAASRTTFVITTAQSGKYVTAEERATNSVGTSSRWAASTRAVVAGALFDSDPAITGTATVGATLSAVANSSNESEITTTRYQWLRCTRAVAASNTQNTACAVITGATASTYVLVAADSGRFTSVRVTLTNDAGSSVRFSASTQATTMAPSNTTAPAPTFSPPTNPRVGDTATASDGKWDGAPAPTYKYTWVHCSDRVSAKSNSLPAGCEEVSETSQSRTYSIPQSASSKYLMVKITASNSIGPTEDDIRTSTIWSPTTAQVFEPPSFVDGPTVTGTPKIGETLTANTLELRGFPAPSASYAWFRCNSKVANISPSATTPSGCTVVTTQTRPTYQLTAADVGKFITPRVTLRNSIGNSFRFAVSTDEITSPPTFTSRPVISGSALVGKTLEASAGVSGTPTPTRVFIWHSCPTPTYSPQDCTERTRSEPTLSTKNSYEIAIADDEEFLVVEVALDNGVEPTPDSQFSIFTAVIKRSPTVVTPSTLEPQEAEVDQPIVGTRGDWDGTPTLQFSNAWYSCTSEVPAATTVLPAGCTVISRQVSTSFTPTVAYERKFIVFAVTATNGTIPETSFSKSTDAVGRAPVYQRGMLARPTAANAASDGSPRVGGTVDAVPGSWIGFPITYTYQWFSCDVAQTAASASLSSDCVDIESATQAQLTVTEAMRGKFLRVKITGSNDFGIDSRFSPTTKKVTAGPSLIEAPLVTGYPYVDAEVESTEGDWAGDPEPSKTIRWWSCASPIESVTTINPAGSNDCVQLATTGPKLKITLNLLGRFISSAVTARNVAGSVTAWSQSLGYSEDTGSGVGGAVTRGAINTKAPTLSTSNPPRADSPVRVNRGTWSGAPALTDEDFEYAWYRCYKPVPASSDTLADGCTEIQRPESVSQESWTTYTPSESETLEFESSNAENPEYKGLHILARVIGRNSNGASATHTASTAQILITPRNTEPPVIEGKASVGFEMTAKPGVWSAIPDPAFAYQWFVCVNSVSAPTTSLPAGCVLVSNAKTDRFTPVLADLGKFALVRVTARNSAGQGVGWSESSLEIVSRPRNTQAPVVTVIEPVSSKPVFPTSSVSASSGTWLGAPFEDFKYQWLSCTTAVTASNTQNAACTVIPGATASTYRLEEPDRARYMMVRVTAKNSEDSTDHYSATSVVINMKARAEAMPIVDGEAFIENTVSAEGDTWVGFPETLAKTYRWVHCAEPNLQISNPLPEGCVTLTSETRSTLKVGSALEGRHLYVGVTADNGFGVSAVSWSSSSDAVTPGPVSISSPVISGVPASGAPHYPDKPPLSSSDGTWVGTPVPTITYQWYRCSSTVKETTHRLPAGAGCEPIPGATENQYLVVENDPSFAIVMGVTGTNTHGSMTEYTVSTEKVTEQVSLQSSPVIDGTPKVGTQMSTNSGTWRGFPTPSIRHLWYSCAARVANPVTTNAAARPPAGCTQISTAGLPRFTPSISQDQRFIVYAATRTNRADGVTRTVTAYSASTEMVTEPPSLLTKPLVRAPAGSATSARPEVGSTWTAVDNWKKQRTPVDPKYQWYRCGLPVATGLTRITALPAECDEIPGAENKQYQIALEDRGKYITFSTTGVQPSETITEWANSTAAVLYVPIANTLPTVSGLRNAPEVLTADPGVWDGLPEPVISYQWFRCGSAVPTTVTTLPAGCISLAGEIEETYSQNALDDPGKFLTVRVTGSSDVTARTSYWVSVTSEQATASIPRNTTAPVLRLVGGRMLVGATLSSLDSRLPPNPTDVWEAKPSFTREYQWYACTAKVDATSDTLPANSPEPAAPICAEIEGATSSEYVLSEANAENQEFILVGVTARNDAGFSTKYSRSTSSLVTKPVENTVPSSITTNGNNLVPTQVVATPGSWEKPNTQLQVTFAWWHCSERIPGPLSYIPNQCSEARGERALNLDLPNDTPYSGRHIVLVETVTDVTGGKSIRLATKVSASTELITETPKLWRSHRNFEEPKVPSKMKLGEPSAGNPGNWLPVYQRPSTIPAGTKFTWRGSPVGVSSVAWYRCAAPQPEVVENISEGSTPPVGCTLIPGATSTSYTPGPADLEQFLGMQITATNDYGTSIVRTASSKPVTDDVKNTAPPTLGDRRTVGQEITVQNGTWTGTPAPTLSRKWFHCPASQAQGASVTRCTEIVGQTDSTLTLQPSMAGRFIVAEVTGLNYSYGEGETLEPVRLSVTTASSLQILEIPVSLTPPTLTGFANVGNTLTLRPGNWRGTEAPTFSHRWIVCATNPGDFDFGNTLPENWPAGCSVTPGSLSSLLLTTSHSGKFIVGQHVATNDSGTRYASSAASGPVTEAPRNLSEPIISAERTSGETITATEGTWAGFPAPVLTYQWHSCPSQVTTPSQSLAGCTALGPVSTSKTLELEEEHAGRFIRVEEIATNTVNGSTTPTSRRKGSISSEAIRTLPEFASTPTISGDHHVGRILTARAGTVSGFETPTLTYTWYGCDSRVTASVSEPEGCALLSGASPTNTYRLTDAAAGKFVIAVVTATNPVGAVSKSSVSAATAASMTPVMSAAPVASVSPANQGNTISVTTGQWRGFPNPTYTYQWFRCTTESAGGSETTPAGCTEVPGATSASYVLAAADASRFMVARVRATIAVAAALDNSTDAFSNSQGPVASQPQFSASPTVTGVQHVGQQLSVSATMTGFPTPTQSFAWYHCANAVTSPVAIEPNGCEQIPGTASTLTIPESASDRFVIAVVTGQNSWTTSPGNSATSRSTTSSVRVSEKPSNTTAPVISGTPAQGSQLAVSTGTWRGFPAPTYSYQWFSCNSAKADPTATVSSDCTAVVGQTSSTFVPRAEDGGKYIVARVRAESTVNRSGDGVTDIVTASTPQISSAPVVTVGVNGTRHVGSVLTATATVTGTPKPLVSIAWYTCPAPVETILTVPGNCTAISGETESQLRLPAAAAGTFVIAAVTATNSWTAVSGNSPVVRTSTSITRVTQTPVNTVAPVHSGSLEVGALLTATSGQWASFPAPLSYQYTWFRCAEEQTLSGNLIGDCAQIASPTTLTTYRLTFADLGKYVVARVTATISVAAGLDPTTDAYTSSRGIIVDSQAQRLSSGQVIRGVSILGMSFQ